MAKLFKLVVFLLAVTAIGAMLRAEEESRTHQCFQDHPANEPNLRNAKRTCDPHHCSLLAVEFVLDASKTKGKQDYVGVVEVFVRREIRSGSSQQQQNHHQQPLQQDRPKKLDWVRVENNGLVEFVDCVPKGQDYELSLYTSTGLKESPSTSNTPPDGVKDTLESPESWGSLGLKISIDDGTVLWKDDEMVFSSDELFFHIGKTMDATQEPHQVEVLDFDRRHIHAREDVGPRSLQQVSDRIRMDSSFSTLASHKRRPDSLM